MLLYYRGLRSTPAPVATIAELAFPATALVVNYLFLDATISFAQLVGMAVLWVTISLLHRAPVRVPEPIEPPLAGPIPGSARLLRLPRPGQPQQQAERLVGAGPMLPQQLRVGVADDRPQSCGDDDGIVQLAGDRDEVGHQVDR